MRSFAAATVIAVAAAVVAAGALVVSIVAELETLGALAGSRMVQVTELPPDRTTADQIGILTGLAKESAVEVALLVPDPEGRAGSWSSYSLRGDPQLPAFGAHIRTEPIGDDADLDLRATYAVTGAASAVAAFIAASASTGYEVTDVTPDMGQALAVMFTRPAVGTAALAVALGVVVALVAESERRERRQTLRRSAGWSSVRVAITECGEVVSLVACALAASGGIVVALLLILRASATTWSAVSALAIPVVVPTVVCIVVAHVLLSVLRMRDVPRPTRPWWPRLVVAGSAAALVVVSALSGTAVVGEREAASELEQRLEADARHGDDVVLGTGFTDLQQDIALGELARGPLQRGVASMAQVSFVEQFVLAGDATAALEAHADFVRDQPVLLVPSVLGQHAAALRARARSELDAGWRVERRSPPRDVDVEVAVVPSTADVNRGVLDWTAAPPPDDPTWPEIPVLVVPKVADIAPNRLGTAVANGEVRFEDRQDLHRIVAGAGVQHLVLQVRRVGAVADGQLANARQDARTMFVAQFVAAVGLVFATWTIVVDHRVRGRRRSRLVALVGRSPVAQHGVFVLVVSVSTVALVSAVVAARASAIGPGLLAGTAAGAAAALFTVSLLALTEPDERRDRRCR